MFAAYAPRLHYALVCSPDDAFLLTSAVDNEIKQYLAVDGRLHMNLDVPKTGLDENFTRSYYTSSGRWVLEFVDEYPKAQGCDGCVQHSAVDAFGRLTAAELFRVVMILTDERIIRHIVGDI